MNTIEEFAKEKIRKINVFRSNLDHISETGRINGSLYLDLIKLSKEIVEFAQRWIPSEEFDLSKHKTSNLLVKFQDGSIMRFDEKDNWPYLRITHYRLIVIE